MSHLWANLSLWLLLMGARVLIRLTHSSSVESRSYSSKSHRTRFHHFSDLLQPVELRRQLCNSDYDIKICSSMGLLWLENWSSTDHEPGSQERTSWTSDHENPNFEIDWISPVRANLQPVHIFNQKNNLLQIDLMTAYGTQHFGLPIRMLSKVNTH